MGAASLIAAIKEFANRILGRGDATITVPSFDGALKPNQKLEQAEILLECVAPEDLATDGANLYLADGPRLLRLDGNASTEIRAFDRPISALACLGGGGLAVAFGGREVRYIPIPRRRGRGRSLRADSTPSTRSRRSRRRADRD